MSNWNEEVIQEINLHENIEKIIENEEYEAHFTEIQSILRNMKKINASEAVKASLKTIFEEIIDITWNEKEISEIEEEKEVPKPKKETKASSKFIITPTSSNKNSMKPISANCSPKGSIASKSSSNFQFNFANQSPRANPSVIPYMSSFYSPKLIRRNSPKSVSARKYHRKFPKLPENNEESKEALQTKILISAYYKKLSKLLATK